MKVYIVMQNDGIVAVWDDELSAQMDIDRRKVEADTLHKLRQSSWPASSLHLRYEEWEVQK